MIGADYCRVMSRYNRWQNTQLAEVLDTFDPEELIRDRGAFFGSILKTANHLLWGDLMWMARLEGRATPGGGISHSTALCGSFSDWRDQRAQADEALVVWADGLDDAALGGDLTWYSAATEQDTTRPRAVCVAHMFNHQTHHRGQIHAMITATGRSAPVSDLVFMTEGA